MFARICASFVVTAWLVLGVAAPAALAVYVPPAPTQPTVEPPPVSGGPPKVNDAPEPATVISAVIGATAAGLFAWRRRSSSAQE